MKVGDLSSRDPDTRLRRLKNKVSFFSFCSYSSRFTTAEAAISAGVILGFLLGSVVTDQLGSVYVFIICSCLSALGLLFGLVRIKNIVPDNNLKSENMEDDNANQKSRWWQRLWSQIKRTIGLPFHKRQPGARPLVLLLCLAFLLGVHST